MSDRQGRIHARRWFAAAVLLVPPLAVPAEDEAGNNAEEEREQTVTQGLVSPEVITEGEAIGPQAGERRGLPEEQNPYRDDENAIRQGRRLFVWFNCYGCHGGRAGGGMGPSLRDAAWIYGNSHADIFNSIHDGRANGMPQYATLLPEDSIWKITAYIKSLNTELEPDPPPRNPSYPDPPPHRDVEGVEAGGDDN